MDRCDTDRLSKQMSFLVPFEDKDKSRRRTIKQSRKLKKTYQLEASHGYQFSNHLGIVRTILAEEIDRHAQFLKGNYTKADIMKSVEGLTKSLKSLQKALFPRFKIVCHLMVGSKVECSGNIMISSRCLWDPKLGDSLVTLAKESFSHFVIYFVYGAYMD